MTCKVQEGVFSIMGMWGTAIFANDGALNFLDTVVDEFAARIDRALGLERRDDKVVEAKSLAQVDLGDLDHIVLPSAAILLRLCARPGTASASGTYLRSDSGLLERLETHAAITDLPSGSQSHSADPVAEWSGAPPPAHVVRAWRDRALEAFDRNIQRDLVSADYLTERPGIITLAFDRLESLAEASEVG